MAKVRHATPEDADALVEMGRALHAESPRYRDSAFDGDKLRALLARLATLPEHAAVLVAERAGELCGGAIIIASERWFGPDRYATDLSVYIKPEHRGNGCFFALVLAIEDWCREHGIGEIDIGVSTDIHVDATVRAYERMGYRLSPTRVVTKKLG